MNQSKTFFEKWLDHNWLYTNFVLAVVMFMVLMWNWNEWEVPQKLVCTLAILIPVHNFEEYLFPNGFFFMNNLVSGSKDPFLYPHNQLLTVITNNGIELLVIVLTFIAPKYAIPLVILTMLFGYLETVVHIVMGTVMWRRYKEIGKKSIYAPGLFTCLTVLVGLSTVSLKWLSAQTITTTDIVMGIVFMLSLMIPFLMMPIAIFTKYHPDKYRQEGLGYFEKYESELKKLNQR